MQWTRDSQTKFNNDKCKVLNIGKDHPEYKYGGRELECTEAGRNLGVIVDKDSTIEQYANESVKKANKIAGMLTHYIL